MPVAPWSKLGDWAPSTNTPTLPVVTTMGDGEYYEVIDAGTFVGMQFVAGDYLWATGGSYQRLDLTEPTNQLIRQVRAGLIAQFNTAFQGLGDLAAVTPLGTPNGQKYLRDDYTWAVPGILPVAITPIAGGSQAATIVTLADVTGSSISLIANMWYEVSYLVTHSAAATTTGAWFSLGGTAGFDFLQATVYGDVLATDASTRNFNAFNNGVPFTSSRATTLNKVAVRAKIHTTTAGTILLRFASEVNASAITITALQGYSQMG